MMNKKMNGRKKPNYYNKVHPRYFETTRQKSYVTK